MAVAFRVVTYNVLSPPLATADYFVFCDPSDLEGHARLERVLAKLEGHTSASAVVCLQEVCREWCGKLHAFFQQRGYSFVTSLYAKQCSDYMGVGIAFPNPQWRLLDADIRRVSETKSWPSQAKKPQERRPGDWACPACGASVFASRTACYKCGAPKPWPGLREALPGCLRPCLGLVRRPRGGQLHGQLREMLALPSARAQGRENVLVAVHLESREQAGQRVWVGCYHMPCAFREPQVMTLHAALAVQQVQRLAIESGSPCVVAGDWNFKPGDHQYKMVTTGAIGRGCPAYPVLADGDRWQPRLRLPMRSAYCAAHGAEPDFTNFAQTAGEEEPFIDTLDYIFCSPHVEVAGAPRLPPRGDVAGPLPNASEPSDHIAVAALLELPAGATAAAAAAYSRQQQGREAEDEGMRQELRAQLAGVSDGPSAGSLDFPPSLSAFQRRLVHELSDELGLRHHSCGEGDARYIRVEKP